MNSYEQTCIFVVDDERIIAETLTTIFQRQGFSAHCYINPLDALDAAHNKAPDFLISDVMMPQLSGFELADRVKRICPHCHVVLISGQAGTMEVMKEASKHQSIIEVLQKPIRPDDLLRNVYQQLSGGL